MSKRKSELRYIFTSKWVKTSARNNEDLIMEADDNDKGQKHSDSRQEDIEMLPQVLPSIKETIGDMADKARIDNNIETENRGFKRHYSKEHKPKMFELIMEIIRSVFLMVIVIFSIVWIADSVKDRIPEKVVVNASAASNTSNKVLPVVIWYTDKFPKQKVTCYQQQKPVECMLFGKDKMPKIGNAYLFSGDTINFTNLPLPRENNTLWGLISKTSPKKNLEILAQDVISLFNFTATFSRHSDISFPLLEIQYLEDLTNSLYIVPAQKKMLNVDGIAPIAYEEYNCETLTGRDEYVKKLMEYIKIDSFGTCLNNNKFPKFKERILIPNLDVSTTESFRLKFLSNYRFMLAIEEAVCEDYSTSRVWQALSMGVIPLYYGSKSIKDYLPTNKSVIFIDDFESPKALTDYLQELMLNNTKYDEYREHKLKPVNINPKLKEEMSTKPHQTDYLEAMDLFICHACKKLHEGPMEQKVADSKHYKCDYPKPILNLHDVDEKNPYETNVTEAVKCGAKFYKELVTANKSV